MHITIIILRCILYLVYLGPCLGVVHFQSQFINHITSLKQTHLVFLEYLLLLLDDNVDQESE